MRRSLFFDRPGKNQVFKFPNYKIAKFLNGLNLSRQPTAPCGFASNFVKH
jgi:hypothetical protein